MALREGDTTAARALLSECLVLQRRLGDEGWLPRTLVGFAGIAVAEGRPVRAARLLGAAEGRRDALGVPPVKAWRPERDRWASSARAALGQDAFAAAWAAGRIFTWEEAIADALSDEDTDG